MKILMVNKFYYIKGGSETYYFALKKLLEQHGHEVIDFSMQDERNFPSNYAEYFVRNINYNGGSVKDKLCAAKDIIYSSEAKRKFEKLVIDTKPDIVHLHIFQHQLSPSILDVIKKYCIPTVYTAHDLKMLCLNYQMMHHGQICEDCKGGKYYNCARHRCVKESFAKSMINVIEGYVHRLRKSYDAIDAIIAPSEFYRKKFIQFGVEENRVYHIPNFLDSDCPNVKERKDKEQYYLYFGRLSKEKGVDTLLDAFRSINAKLYIVGTGPLEEEIIQRVKNERMYNVHVLGFKLGQELTDIVGNAKAIILPSEWYENGPYSVIESLQLGRPIIGADIGGISELVKENGFLFESGNADALKKAILSCDKLDVREYRKLVDLSFELFQEKYTSDEHYKKLYEVYKYAVKSKRII